MKLNCPATVLKAVKNNKKPTDGFYIFYLNQNKNIITSHVINKESIQVAEAIIPAMYLNAKCIVIAHYTQSRRSLKATTNELHFCKKIQKATKFVTITFLDYLIITKKRYISFHESKLI